MDYGTTKILLIIVLPLFVFYLYSSIANRTFARAKRRATAALWGGMRRAAASPSADARAQPARVVFGGFRRFTEDLTQRGQIAKKKRKKLYKLQINQKL